MANDQLMKRVNLCLLFSVSLLLIGPSHSVEHLHKLVHPRYGLHHSGDDHVDEREVVSLSRGYCLGQVGAEAEERGALPFTPGPCVVCYCF